METSETRECETLQNNEENEKVAKATSDVDVVGGREMRSVAALGMQGQGSQK
jgi:hypothetical protein